MVEEDPIGIIFIKHQLQMLTSKLKSKMQLN